MNIHPTAIIGKAPLAPAGLLARNPQTTGRTVYVGDGTIIGPNTIIYEGVSIGRDCLIGDGAVIREGTTIGDECVIGMHVTIGDQVTIGDRTRVLDHSHLTPGTRVGSDVFIGPGVMTANDNTIGWAATGELAPPVICDQVKIGMQAALLPGVTIGEGATVGACALVTRDVPPGVLVMGMPARVIESQ